MSADWTLFKLLNGLAGRSPALDTVIRMLMNDYALTTALVLFLFGLWFSGGSRQVRERNQKGVLLAVVSMLVGNLSVKALNLLFYRPRPFADHTVRLLFYRPSDSSFPSNATAVGFSLATAVWFWNRRAGWAMYALAILLGLSRICGGVHYPSDILGGILLGACAAYLVVKRAPLLSGGCGVIIGHMQRLLLA
jgi:undecaprenyl-diphosphatase